MAYHFGGLGSRDVEFEVGIFLPVAEEKRKFEEKSVVGVAEGRQGLGTRVPVEPALKALTGANQLLPILKVVGIRFLSRCGLAVGSALQNARVLPRRH